MVVMAVSGRLGMAMRILRRGLMSVLVVSSGGVAVIVVTMVAVGRGRRVIVMAVRSRGGMIIMPMIAMGRRVSVIIVAMIGGFGSMPMVVMAGGLGGRMGVGVVTVSGVVTGAMAVTCAVIVVRLVLVAHCDSVPQPLFAVFAAKSV